MIKESSSLRDPGGFLFYEKNVLYRLINKSYKENFDHFINSGLYKSLLDLKYIIHHHDTDISVQYENYKIIKPDKISFISYPYEWCFSQFKAAALLTLKIQHEAVKLGMTLKDATPYNVQFVNNNPLFIDTLSFEIKDSDDYSWAPLRQFIEMFLGPLILISHENIESNLILKNKINGIPLSEITKNLSLKTKIKPFIFFNILIANILSKKSSKETSSKKMNISKNQHLNIIESYISFIENLNLKKYKTEWMNYNNETEIEKGNYRLDKKKYLITFLSEVNAEVIWDVGANDGHYSRIVSDYYKRLVDIYSLDIDPICVEKNFELNIGTHQNINPLLFDIANPSTAIGWLNSERKNIFSRLPTPNLIIALALLHHVLNLNIKLQDILSFFSKTTSHLIIEYISISDEKAQSIFQSRIETVEYPSKNTFETEISKFFKIIKSEELLENKRYLYLLKKI